MKQFRIEVEYDEPMRATALIVGETQEAALASFNELAVQRGLHNVRILELVELSVEEANEIRAAYEMPAAERTIQ